jgi:hypothetical protein
MLTVFLYHVVQNLTPQTKAKLSLCTVCVHMRKRLGVAVGLCMVV